MSDINNMYQTCLRHIIGCNFMDFLADYDIDTNIDTRTNKAKYRKVMLELCAQLC